MMTRRASHALASSRSAGIGSSLGFSPCRASESGKRLPLAWAHQSATAPCSLLGDAAFAVAPRRQHQVRHFLTVQLPAKSVARAEAAVKALQSHVVARLGFLVRAQQAVRQQLDRTSHWRPFRRARAPGGEDSPRFTPGTARATRQALRCWEQGVAHERAMQLDEAIACYEKATQADPAKVEYWAHLSKALSDCSYVRGTTTEQAKELHRRAIDVGVQAVAADPNSAFGHVACCISRGRLALYLDNRTKVQLARQAQDDVRRALELEPSNDVAHHLLGRWNYEMASVNAMVRTLIQMLYGTSLMAGSYREAALCYEAAVRIRPDYLIHRVELGRTYARIGQREAAREHLEAAVGLDVPDINAMLQREDALAMLAKMGSRPR